VELELSRAATRWVSGRSLVDKHRFYRQLSECSAIRLKLRGAVSPEARVIIETKLGEEAQVDYGTGPMGARSGLRKYVATRLFVLTLGCSSQVCSSTGLSGRVRGCGRAS